jgi:hypothetical protein
MKTVKNSDCQLDSNGNIERWRIRAISFPPGEAQLLSKNVTREHLTFFFFFF